MTSSGGPRLQRKNENLDKKTEPARKALKKNEILLQFDALQQKYLKLEAEHQVLLQEKERFIEAISLLEETIQVLEAKNEKVEKKSVDVQTEMIRCDECEYPAEDLLDLGEHLYVVHTLEDQSNDIKCYFCDNRFKTKSEIMTHRKKEHVEKVDACRLFSEGKCYLGDMDCWYTHSESNKTFKCKYCENEFKNRYDFMKHRKEEHPQFVPNCRKETNGTCQFGAHNCWFKHIEIENSNEHTNIDKNQELIGKLFNMVEKFTQRILELEEKVK